MTKSGAESGIAARGCVAPALRGRGAAMLRELREVDMASDDRSARDTEAQRTAKLELANRLFFRLYQCANMMHKTGTRAVDDLGITSQQWAVLGALSRPVAADGMSVGDLARYLMVSRQNLSGVLGRMERDGRLSSSPDKRDRRARLVKLTPAGWRVWTTQVLPRIQEYYECTLEGFSINDMTHAVHYLLKLLDNMRRVDEEGCDAGAIGQTNAGE